MDCKYYYDEFLKNKKENENNFEKKNIHENNFDVEVIKVININQCRSLFDKYVKCKSIEIHSTKDSCFKFLDCYYECLKIRKK